MLVSSLSRAVSVETLFQSVTQNFHGRLKPSLSQSCFVLLLHAVSVQPLAHSQQCWGVCMGIKSSRAIRFYLVDDIHGIYRGMMIAIPPVHWQCFQDCTLNQLVDILKH